MMLTSLCAPRGLILPSRGQLGNRQVTAGGNDWTGKISLDRSVQAAWSSHLSRPYDLPWSLSTAGLVAPAASGGVGILLLPCTPRGREGPCSGHLLLLPLGFHHPEVQLGQGKQTFMGPVFLGGRQQSWQVLAAGPLLVSFAPLPLKSDKT